MVQALLCTHCGARLPPPALGSLFVQCGFCQTTVQLASAPPPAAREPNPAAPPAAGHGPGRDDYKRFSELLAAACASGTESAAAIHAAARGAFARFGDPSGVATAVTRLVREFGAANDADISRDALAVARVFEAYVRARMELATQPEARINLPFLTATSRGPLHMDRRLLGAELAQLERR